MGVKASAADRCDAMLKDADAVRMPYGEKNQADEPKDARSKARDARVTPRYANKV